MFLLIGCGTLQKKKGMSLKEVREASQESLDAQITSLAENTDPQLTDIIYWIDNNGGSYTSQKMLWSTLLDDTKGSGDTKNVWSADKIYGQLDLRALKSTVGSSLDSNHFHLVGGALTLQDEIPLTDEENSDIGPWGFKIRRNTLQTSAITASELRIGDTVKVSVTDWDPVGFGGTVNYETTLVEDTTELMPNTVDRDLSGASAWANVDFNSYDETGDLSLTASAADQYCTLPAASAPTTSTYYYAIHYDASGLTGTLTIKDYDGTNTIGIISANGTDQYIVFLADDSNGGLRIISNETNSSVNLDNFSLTRLIWNIDRNDSGSKFTSGDQSTPNLVTLSGAHTLTTAEMNSYIRQTATGDIDIPADQCDTATMNWICASQDSAFTMSITSLDTSDQFILTDGTVTTAGNEIDSGGSAENQVCVMCVAAHKYKVYGEIGIAVDGGGAD